MNDIRIVSCDTYRAFVNEWYVNEKKKVIERFSSYSETKQLLRYLVLFDIAKRHILTSYDVYEKTMTANRESFILPDWLFAV